MISEPVSLEWQNPLVLNTVTCLVGSRVATCNQWPLSCNLTLEPKSSECEFVKHTSVVVPCGRLPRNHLGAAHRRNAATPPQSKHPGFHGYGTSSQTFYGTLTKWRNCIENVTVCGVCCNTSCFTMPDSDKNIPEPKRDRSGLSFNLSRKSETRVC